ncbi:hypothetical protein HanXRQr2_Chr14g0637641 [Helianthus annuus]|uniref:Uncharacterized protein n=1 Tax=Helianthus annuus TaxID=4232 RepID=A0A9K3E9M7_HELAN|nr:hypothetical protein HanXRQr2_Chr14g0637641 [Helianthus annuus]
MSAKFYLGTIVSLNVDYCVYYLKGLYLTQHTTGVLGLASSSSTILIDGSDVPALQTLSHL